MSQQRRPQMDLQLRLDTLSLHDHHHQRHQRQRDDSDTDSLSQSSEFDESTTTTTADNSPSRETFYTSSSDRRHVRWSAELVEIINRAEQQKQKSQRRPSVLQKLRSPFVRTPSTTSKEMPPPIPRRQSYITRKPSKQAAEKSRVASW